MSEEEDSILVEESEEEMNQASVSLGETMNDLGSNSKSTSVSEEVVESEEVVKEVKRSIPPPGNGQNIYELDPLLRNYRTHIDYR